MPQTIVISIILQRRIMSPVSKSELHSTSALSVNEPDLSYVGKGFMKSIQMTNHLVRRSDQAAYALGHTSDQNDLSTSRIASSVRKDRSQPRTI